MRRPAQPRADRHQCAPDSSMPCHELLPHLAGGPPPAVKNQPLVKPRHLVNIIPDAVHAHAEELLLEEASNVSSMPPKKSLPAVVVWALHHSGNGQKLEFTATPDGSLVLKNAATKRAVGVTDQEQQLMFKYRGCAASSQYYKCCQVLAVTQELKSRGAEAFLMCPICTPVAQLAALRINGPAAEHAKFVKWITRELPAVVFYLEHALQGYAWWHGLVDI